MTIFPALIEDHISQIPALQLLQHLGYVYLRPQEVFLERKGKLSNVLLEGILESQLRKLNRITFKGDLYEFSDANLQDAIQALKHASLADGLIRANEKIYDLMSLGRSLEQTIGGETKSFTLNYLDWKNPENNVYHVVAEFEVEQTGGRPDLVLFINGIPFVVIECKRPDEKDSLEVAISQQLRNQQSDCIPRLFIYSQLLLAVNRDEAKYATTGTPKEFWSHWRERPGEMDFAHEVNRLANKPLAKDQKEKIYADRFAYAREYFDELEMDDRLVTEQDLAIYNLCRPQRLIELVHQFVVFDGREKKIARYQQYFAIKKTMSRIKRVGMEGKRTGGVIWQAHGSGRLLTMVMMAKAIALEPGMTDPRIVLVTDRVDLDDQIQGAFHSCGKEPVRTKTGKHLLEILSRNKEAVMTTLIDKFETAIKSQNYQNFSNNIFVLVDESHRGRYGEQSARLQKLLPNACYLGFTGTPLKKKDKPTAARLGGMIDAYPIDQAVNDKAIVPLLYERRHIDISRRIKKISPDTRDQKIYLIARDISEHFSKNIDKPFKARLTADSKLSALKFKKYLDESGKLSSEILISGPDIREGDGVDDRDGGEEVQTFWKLMMDKHGNEKEYNRSLINAFIYGDRPEIIIVVDKLMRGFDAPRNQVLYLARRLKGHALLQAITRVNRLYPGKDFGYIIDYEGTHDELNGALDPDGSLSEFDREDLKGALTEIREEASRLSQRYSELWDIFKEVGNRIDEEAFEQSLADEVLRDTFYARLLAFSRTFSVAFSSVKFINQAPEELIELYKRDLAYFQRLRISVKRRYAEEVDSNQYEAMVKRLIKSHVNSNEVIPIAPLVNIFDCQKFQAEIDQLQSTAAKADTIAHRTKRTIIEKMDEDPFFFRRFPKILEEVIQAWRDKRISDEEYLSKVVEVSNTIINRTTDNLPEELQGHGISQAIYGLVNDVLNRWKDALPGARKIAAKAALKIDRIIQENKIVDWTSNPHVQNQMKNQIEDYLYALKEVYGIDLSVDDMDLILDQSIEIAKERWSHNP